MYILKGTTISYRMVNVENDKGVEQEMVLTNKDVFESIITMIGFKNEKQIEQKEHEENKEQIEESKEKKNKDKGEQWHFSN